MKFINKYDPLKDEKVEILDQNGKIINSNLMPKISKEEIIRAYKIMNLSRRQDMYQNMMQRQGRLLSFLSSTGQEACEVAYTMLLNPSVDHFASGYRNNAAWLTMGMPVRNIMMYWAGNEAGFAAPKGVNSLPPNIVIGSQFSHATGLAFADKFLNKPGIAVTTTGDGGMSEGETYEAMNFAKVHEVPVIFICENNKWSISTHKGDQTKSLNFAVKSIASGIPSIKVDGNDFLASYAVMQEVIEFVRSGQGPFFIEFDTYRLGAHSSSDDPKVYRPEGEFEAWAPKDPLIRLKAYMIANKMWTDKDQEALDAEQDAHVAAEFVWMEENKDYPIEDIFQYTYAEMTPILKEQLAEAKAFFEKYPNSKGGHH